MIIHLLSLNSMKINSFFLLFFQHFIWLISIYFIKIFSQILVNSLYQIIKHINILAT